ncbi:MAG: aminopeptidase P family protein [Alphaproteobacteria bacterium]
MNEAADKLTSTKRIAALRAELTHRDLSGFVVPLADEHQGEYVPPSARRLAWLTGFNGSAGTAIVLRESAALFVDGRYTLQAREEADGAIYEFLTIPGDKPGDWIEANLPAGGKLGYDAWLHTEDGAKRLGEACRKAGGELVASEGNPLDAVWTGRPPAPSAKIYPHGLEFAGVSSADKRARIGGRLRKDKIGAAVLSLPDSIAWLLNIRGGDVPRAPLPLSFAILHADTRVELFIDPRKLGEEIVAHFGEEIALSPPDALGPALDRLGAQGMGVLADPASAGDWLFKRLDAAGARIVRRPDPCQLAKACKNAVELEGARRAHRRDGAALTRFLAWLAGEIAKGDAARGGVSEMAAADRLEAFRRENDRFRDLSFDTISGAGPNGAIVHYRVSEASNRRLEPGQLYLVDSGAQYLDGTTDVTRTLAIGAPSDEMRDRFTRVLKGHIALASVRFPKGTTGSQLDALARQPLWRAGLDFDHGTGHGVGSYLSVHEGPQRISKLASTVALEPGMICSIEPGYYKQGAYGIRIENLVAVRPAEGLEGSEREMLEFETLTLAPIELALVDASLMSESEIAWLDAYHARVREEIGPLVDKTTQAWLAQATLPVTGN